VRKAGVSSGGWVKYKSGIIGLGYNWARVKYGLGVFRVWIEYE